MSLQRQTPINGTYQKRVLPGSQTNLYYILLSNLPWQTSWQQLKDHVRAVCPVERVEVFNESTTGWVSVRGRNNFDAAFDLLNGGIFNGRPLFADGKNATDPVMIKEPVDAAQANKHTPIVAKHTRQPSPPSTSRRGAASTVMPLLPPASDQWYYSSPSCAVLPVPTTDFLMHSGMRDVVYSYESSPRLLPIFSNGDSETQCAQPTWPVGAVDYPAESYYTPVRQPQIPSHPKLSRSLGYDAAPSESYPRTTPPLHAGFTVLVRHIAPHVTYSEFDCLLRHKIGRDVDSVLHLELPISESYDSNSGYAVAIFSNEEAASRAVRKFHGTKFENRILKAELTSETATPENVRPSMRSRKTKQGDKEKPSRASGQHEQNKKPRPTSRTGVIIANGSSSLRGTSQKS